MTQLGTYPRAITIPPFSKGTKEQGINCVVKAVEWQMDMDRKISGMHNPPVWIGCVDPLPFATGCALHVQ